MRWLFQGSRIRGTELESSRQLFLAVQISQTSHDPRFELGCVDMAEIHMRSSRFSVFPIRAILRSYLLSSLSRLD